jgi:hypothetical protein
MRALRPWLISLLVGVVMAAAGAARAQDDGPRVYQVTPQGARAFTAFAVAKRGNEGPEIGSVAPGKDIDTDLLVLRYVQTLRIGDRAFSPFVILPLGEARTTIHQPGVSTTTTSSGIGDAQFGATLGLIGSPALSADEFAVFAPRFNLALLGRIFFPTGDYTASRPVNLGSNRISYQVGLYTAFARGSSYRDPSLTTLEILPTLTFYEANNDPYAAGRSAKDTLFSVEAHLTRNLNRKVWVSGDLLYRRGGETTTDGVGDQNATHGWSAGGSIGFPFIDRTSLILTYQGVVHRDDDGPEGWFFRTALVVPF